ncbi:MAG: hypothetical protein JRN62_03630 [Nitrososphaerota archaeon]|jgi:hypothetical protein|nr:hypothetical protein [Nitrososphaerota archaeon]MDG6948692.1 hypothetical protein [Nitrososphaerota archaeon]
MEIKESTGRARCRRCGQLIEKGGYQVLEEGFDNYGRLLTSRFHSACYLKLLEDRAARALAELKQTKKRLVQLYARMGKTPWSK